MNNDESYQVLLEVDSTSKMQNLFLEGELGIANAEAIRLKLLSMDFTGDVNIKLRNVETLDLSSLQLVYSFIKSLHSKGFKANLESELPERMKDSLKNTGFLEFVKA
jgi:anti-anti-sigma regulatory factor